MTSPATQGLPDSATFTLTDTDRYLFNEGTHARLYDKLGAHLCTHHGVWGAYFAVWAPDATSLTVAGDFNDWNPTTHGLAAEGATGIWAGFVAGAMQGQCYKYHIVSRYGGNVGEKADPFAFACELPPKTASVLWDLRYTWSDDVWMAGRAERQRSEAPMSTYEVHLGSWRRGGPNGDQFLSYREAAGQLAEYVRDMGFTHVELMPITEHPFYGSWGYQTTGYFAPTSRYGTPQDFMYLVDTLHQAGIGVVLDWVPSHFPNDAHGLGYFDGTHLYEHADIQRGLHPDWDTYIFNYGRHEVRSFLISSAAFWYDRYHIDSLRIDAVASMLYLDYSRQPGEWQPNRYGGRENLEAIEFLHKLNEELYAAFPGTQTIAEESTAWPGVSRPVYLGGLGFGFKWDMGWMHDTRSYMGREPVHRAFHHHEITFRALYAFHENFVLPLSHDEVVHGKGSLLGRMPGDDWQRFANLRLLLALLYSQPGKKLLFMGGEFGQWAEWDHDRPLDWHLLQHPPHQGVQAWVRDLNRTYRSEPALHQLDCEPTGFQWVDADDAPNSTYTLLRRDAAGHLMLVVLNATPVVRHDYRAGVPLLGRWNEVLNSDATIYGGSGQGNLGGVQAGLIPHQGQPFSVTITLPPLGAVFFTSPHTPLDTSVSQH